MRCGNAGPTRRDARSGPVCLYAVVPAGEIQENHPRLARGLSLLVVERAAAIVGPVPRHTDAVQAAVAHDRVVASALAICSSVIPCQLGAVFSCRERLHTVLAAHADRLGATLTRLFGRVEMGLKARLGADDSCGQAGWSPTLGSMQLPSGLEQVHSLAPASEDRCEKVLRDARGRLFEGCYLIPRPAIDVFWDALEEMRRRAVPNTRFVGTGPWAPYSFCDVALPGERGTSRDTLRDPSRDILRDPSRGTSRDISEGGNSDGCHQDP